MGPGVMQICTEWLWAFEARIVEFGVPLTGGKTKGPTTRLQFLGIQLDTVQGLSNLPGRKLFTLKKLPEETLAKKKKKKHLQADQVSLWTSQLYVQIGPACVGLLCEAGMGHHRSHSQMPLHSTITRDPPGPDGLEGILRSF